MKLLIPFLLLTGFAGTAFGQKPEPLPLRYYIPLMDSTTSLDAVFFLGDGGSISLGDRNIKIFNHFFENVSAPKPTTPQAGTMMWEINGREFLSGSFYLGDTTGCIVFNIAGKEYINRINQQGNNFFKTRGKKP